MRNLLHPACHAFQENKTRNWLQILKSECERTIKQQSHKLIHQLDDDSVLLSSCFLLGHVAIARSPPFDLNCKINPDHCVRNLCRNSMRWRMLVGETRTFQRMRILMGRINEQQERSWHENAISLNNHDYSYKITCVHNVLYLGTVFKHFSTQWEILECQVNQVQMMVWNSPQHTGSIMSWWKYMLQIWVCRAHIYSANANQIQQCF